QMRNYYAGAVPQVASSKDAHQTAYLLVPQSEAGEAFGQSAQSWHSDLHLTRMQSLTEMTVCREQGNLGYKERNELFSSFRNAYPSLATVPAHSPHARFDVLDWLPLED